MSRRHLPPSKRPERREEVPFPPPGPPEHWTGEQRIAHMARFFTSFQAKAGRPGEVIRLDIHKSFEEACDKHSTAVETAVHETDTGPEVFGNAAAVFQYLMWMMDVDYSDPAIRRRLSRVVDEAITAELQSPSPLFRHGDGWKGGPG